MRPADILAVYTHNSLRTIGRLRGLAPGALRRPELIMALADTLFDPEYLRTAVDRLSPGERAVLQRVADEGGRMASSALAQTLREHGDIDSMGPARPRETIDRIPPTTRNFDELCARLTAAGLLFSEQEPSGTPNNFRDLSPGQIVFVPSQVLSLLHRAPTIEEPTSKPPLPASGPLIVQPSYTVLLLPPLDPALIERVGGFAEQVRVAEIAEFRLTQAALFNAVERGERGDQIVAFLEERSGGALPQNVRYALDSWSAGFEQVLVLTHAALIEAEPSLIERIVADDRIAPLVVRRIADDRLLLRDTEAAEQALAAIDEIPHRYSYDQPSSETELRLHPDGTIDLISENLRLPIALRRIGEPAGDRRFRLTPERVRATVESAPDGLTGLLKWLRQHGGEPPAPLVQRLRIWSLPPDSVALEQPLLLRLPAELLDDLRRDDELGPLLADEFHPSSALVRIDPDQQEALLAALRARGVLPPDG